MAPFVGLLMVPLMAMVVFAVDLGYIKAVQVEVQNAADAAALAGAAELMNRDWLRGMSPYDADDDGNEDTFFDPVRGAAQAFGAANRAGGAPMTLDRNDSNSPGGDIVIGRIDRPSDPTCPMVFDKYPYNSVRVRARRTEARNGALDLFFAPVLGVGEIGLQAFSTATLEDAIGGFRITETGPQTSRLLPFALEISYWNDVIAGNGPDLYGYDPETGEVTLAGDGIKEARLFPSRGVAPGNFATIDIGGNNNSNADIKRQILHGPNKADFDQLGGQLALGPSGTLQLPGDTGVSAGFESELQGIIGQKRILPLYRAPVVGSGNNALFTIVGFAGVVITDVNLNGALSQKGITIQPEFVWDETAFSSDLEGTSYFVFRPLKLTR
ncbi:MAG TPA: pilus assembly protein TadG-related protein [Gemmataceae bacterium]